MSYFGQVSLLVGLLVGVLARDAVRIVVFSALSLPALVLFGAIGPGVRHLSLMERLGEALWAYLAFNGGMVAALFVMVAWQFVSRETVIPARSRQHVAARDR